jgi:predicted nucleic acid-binding protein
MNHFVVDASVAVKWYVEEPGHAAARELLADIDRLCAPDIVFAEVSYATLRKMRRGEITADLAREAILTVRDSFGGIIESRPLLARATELSIQFDHSFYDCLYLACAEVAEAVLVTADDKLARKVAGTPLGTYVYGVEEAQPLLDLEITPFQVREIRDMMTLARQTRETLGNDRVTASSASIRLLRHSEGLPTSVREDLFAIASFANFPGRWSDLRSDPQHNNPNLTDIGIWEGWRRLFGRDP